MPDLITLDEYERRLAEKYGVPLAIVQSVRGVESGSQHMDPKKPDQVLTSHKGARSRFQVMPDTFKEMGGTDPDDVWDNTYAGIKYLAKGYQEAQKYDIPEDKKWAAALVHYHGGPGGLESSFKTGRFRSDADPAKGIAGMHSDAYARKVLANARKLRERGVGGDYTDEAQAPTTSTPSLPPGVGEYGPAVLPTGVGEYGPAVSATSEKPRELAAVQPAPQYRAAPARHATAGYGQPTIAGAPEAYPLGSPQRPTPENPTWLGRQRQAAIAGAPVVTPGFDTGLTKDDFAAAQRKAVADRVRETAEAAKPNKIESRWQTGSMMAEARAKRAEINSLDMDRMMTLGLMDKDHYQKERDRLVREEKAILQQVQERQTADPAGIIGGLPTGAAQMLGDLKTVLPYAAKGAMMAGTAGALAGGAPAIPGAIGGGILGSSYGYSRLLNWDDPSNIPSNLIEMSLPVAEYFGGGMAGRAILPKLTRIANPYAKKIATGIAGAGVGGGIEGLGAQASNLPDVLRGKISPYEGLFAQPVQEFLLGSIPGTVGGLDVQVSPDTALKGDIPKAVELARRRQQWQQEPIQELPAAPAVPTTPTGPGPEFVTTPPSVVPGEPTQPGLPGILTEPGTQPEAQPTAPGEIEDPRTTDDPHRFFTRDETEPVIPNLTERVVTDQTPRVAREKGWLESMLSNDLPFYSKRGRSVFLDPDVRRAVGEQLIELDDRGVQALHNDGKTPVSIDSLLRPLARIPWEDSRPADGGALKEKGGNAIKDTHAGLRAIMRDRLLEVSDIKSLKEVTLSDYVDWFNESIPSNSPAWAKLRNVYEALGEQWPEHAIVQKRSPFTLEDIQAMPETAEHLDVSPDIEEATQKAVAAGQQPEAVQQEMARWVDHYGQALMRAMTPIAQAAHRVGGRADYSQLDARVIGDEAEAAFVAEQQAQPTTPAAEPTVEPTAEPTPAPIDPTAPAPGDTQATRLAKQRQAQQQQYGTPEAVAMRREGVEGQVQETPADLATAMRNIQERMTPTPTPVPTPTTPTPPPTAPPGATPAAKKAYTRRKKGAAPPTETVVTEEAPDVTAKPGFGESNTIGTKESFDDAVKRFWNATKGGARGESLGALGAKQMGEMLSALFDMGVYFAEGGARSFADWSKAMLAQVGEHAALVSKHLPHIYRQMREIGTEQTWEGFSADEEIEAHGKAVAAAVVEKPTVTKAKARVAKNVTPVPAKEPTTVTPTPEPEVEAVTPEARLAELDEEEARLIGQLDDDPDMHPDAAEQIEDRLVNIELERADIQDKIAPKGKGKGKGKGAKAAATVRVAKTQEPTVTAVTPDTPIRATVTPEGVTKTAWEIRVEEDKQRKEAARLADVQRERANKKRREAARARQAPVPVALTAKKQRDVDGLTIHLAELEQNRAKAADALDALVKDPKSTLRDQRKARQALDQIKKERDAANTKVWNLTLELRTKQATQVKAEGEESQLLIPGRAKGKPSDIPLAGPPDVARKEAALYKILEGTIKTRKDVRGSGPQWSTSVQGLYELGRYYIDLGVYKFSEWSSRVAQDLRELKLDEAMYPYFAEVYGQLRSESPEIKKFSTAKAVAEHIRRKEPVMAKAMEAEGKPFNPLAMPETPPPPVPRVEIRRTPPESDEAFTDRIGLAMGDIQFNRIPELKTLLAVDKQQKRGLADITLKKPLEEVAAKPTPAEAKVLNELTLELMFRRGFFKTWDEFGRAIRLFAEPEEPLSIAARWTPEQIEAQREAALAGKPSPIRKGEGLVQPGQEEGMVEGGTRSYSIASQLAGLDPAQAADVEGTAPGANPYEDTKGNYALRKQEEWQRKREQAIGKVEYKHPNATTQTYVELSRKQRAGKLDAEDHDLLLALRDEVFGPRPALGPELTDEQFIRVRELVDERRLIDTRINNLQDFKTRMEGAARQLRIAAEQGQPVIGQAVDKAIRQMKQVEVVLRDLNEEKARIDDQILEAKGIERKRKKQRLSRAEELEDLQGVKVRGPAEPEILPTDEELGDLGKLLDPDPIFGQAKRKQELEAGTDEEADYEVAMRQRKAAQKRGDDVAFIRAEVREELEARDRGERPKLTEPEIKAKKAEQKARHRGLPLRVIHRIYPEQLWKAIKEAAGRLIAPSMAVAPADFPLHRIGGPIALIGDEDLTGSTHSGDMYSPNTPEHAPLPYGQALEFQIRLSDAHAISTQAFDVMREATERVDVGRNIIHNPHWENPDKVEAEIRKLNRDFHEQYEALYRQSPHDYSAASLDFERQMEELQTNTDSKRKHLQGYAERNRLRERVWDMLTDAGLSRHLIAEKDFGNYQNKARTLLTYLKDDADEAIAKYNARRGDYTDIEQEKMDAIAALDSPEAKLRAMRMGETGTPRWRAATGSMTNPVIQASLIAPRLRNVEAIRERFRKQGGDTLTDAERSAVRQDIAARQRKAEGRLDGLLYDIVRTEQILTAAVLERERPPLQRKQHLLEAIARGGQSTFDTTRVTRKPTDAEIARARKILDRYMQMKDNVDLRYSANITGRPVDPDTGVEVSVETLERKMDQLSENDDLAPAMAYLVAQDYANHIADYPQSYFEAKPRKLLPLSKYKAAVVPHGTEPDLMQALRDYGLYVREMRPDAEYQPVMEDPLAQVPYINALDEEVRNLIAEGELAFARAQDQFDAAYQPIRELFPRTQWDADVELENIDGAAAIKAARFTPIEHLNTLGDVKAVESNHAMSQVLGAVLSEMDYTGGRWDALVIPKDMLGEMALRLRRYGPEATRMAEYFSDAAKTIMYGNRMIFLNSGAHITDNRLYYTALHELDHAFIFDVSGKLAPWEGKFIEGEPEYSHLLPAIQKLEGGNINSAMVEKEAPAYVLSGSWKDLGFDSPESATDFLRRYVRKLANDFGVEGLARWPLALLQDVDDSLTSVIKEIQNEIQEKGKAASQAEKSRGTNKGVGKQPKAARAGAPVLPGGGQAVPGGGGAGAGQGGGRVGRPNPRGRPQPAQPAAGTGPQGQPAGQGTPVQRPVTPNPVTVNGVTYNVLPPPQTPVVGPPPTPGVQAAANRAVQHLGQTLANVGQNIVNVGNRPGATAGGGAGQGGGVGTGGSRIGKAAQLAQQASMLATIKFWMQNVGGAWAMMGFEVAPGGVGQMAALVDQIISKTMGAERTFARPTAQDFRAGREVFKTFNEAAKQAGNRFEGIELGGTLPTQAPMAPGMSYRAQPAFDPMPANPFGTGKAAKLAMSATEGNLDKANRRPDIMAWTSHYVANSMALLRLEESKAKKAGRTLTPEDHENIHLESAARANYNTMRHPNYVSTALTHLKNSLNNITLIPEHIRTKQTYEQLRQNQAIGLGDFFGNVKFTNFPGAVAHHMINKSMLGLFRTVQKYAKYTQAKRHNAPNVKQLRNEAIHSLGEVLSSQLWMGGMFFPLGFLGIMAPGAQSHEEEQTQRSMGKEPFGFNFSVLARWVTSGFDPAMLEWRPEDDLVIRISQYFAPIAGSAELMAQMGYDARVGSTTYERSLNILNAYANFFDTISELTVGERVIADFLSAAKQAQGEGLHKLGDMLARLSRTAITSAAGQLAPTLLYQMTQRKDPWRREFRQQGTSGEEAMPYTLGMVPSFETLKNKVKSRIPGLSETLPEQLNIFGEPVEHQKGTAKGGFWDWKNWTPGTITTTERSRLKEEMLRLNTLPHAVQRNAGETAADVRIRSQQRGGRIKEGGDVLLESPAWEDAGTLEKKYLLRNLYNRATDPTAKLSSAAFVAALKEYRLKEAEGR